jgi:hypothetical protein
MGEVTLAHEQQLRSLSRNGVIAMGHIATEELGATADTFP